MAKVVQLYPGGGGTSTGKLPFQQGLGLLKTYECLDRIYAIPGMSDQFVPDQVGRSWPDYLVVAPTRGLVRGFAQTLPLTLPAGLIAGAVFSLRAMGVTETLVEVLATIGLLVVCTEEGAGTFLVSLLGGFLGRRAILNMIPTWLPESSQPLQHPKIRRLAKKIEPQWLEANAGLSSDNPLWAVDALEKGQKMLLGEKLFAAAEAWGCLAGLVSMQSQGQDTASFFRNQGRLFTAKQCGWVAQRMQLYALLTQKNRESEELERQLGLLEASGVKWGHLVAYWDHLVFLLGYASVWQSPVRAFFSR